MNKTLGLVLITAGGFAAGLGAGLWIGRSQIPTPPPPAWLYTEFNDITKPGHSLQQLIQDRPDLWREINAELIDLKPRIDEFRARLKEIDGDFRRDFEAILNESQRKKLALLQQRRELPPILTTFPKPDAPASSPAPAKAAAKEEAPASAKAETAAPSAANASAPLAAAPSTKETAVPPTSAKEPSVSAPKPANTKPQPGSAQPKVFHERVDGMIASFVFAPYTQARFAQALDLDEEQEEKLGLLLKERRTRFLKLCDDTPPPSLQLNRISEIIRRAEQEKK